ncbi:hypothetical protein L210DRAFT_2811355 [Boletus edulis BED1]|uniref:Uncharacterized protein n=1 Tax=Boletus edulis BED1 TaxID=1328754 RepID=A0AAD4C386_BOLED|nr:hypothetical protein L210DRAFT_2811355 [Boletus edulis BED1]
MNALESGSSTGKECEKHDVKRRGASLADRGSTTSSLWKRRRHAGEEEAGKENRRMRGFLVCRSSFSCSSFVRTRVQEGTMTLDPIVILGQRAFFDLYRFGRTYRIRQWSISVHLGNEESAYVRFSPTSPPGEPPHSTNAQQTSVPRPRTVTWAMYKDVTHRRRLSCCSLRRLWTSCPCLFKKKYWTMIVPFWERGTKTGQYTRSATRLSTRRHNCLNVWVLGGISMACCIWNGEASRRIQTARQCRKGTVNEPYLSREPSWIR